MTRKKAKHAPGAMAEKVVSRREMVSVPKVLLETCYNIIITRPEFINQHAVMQAVAQLQKALGTTIQQQSDPGTPPK